MGEPASHDTFLSAFAAPAAWCDASGVLLACNALFEAWAGPVLGELVEIHGARGALVRPGQPPRHLTMSPLVDGSWLALGSFGDGQGVVNVVTAAVAQRLERVQVSLEANAQFGLLEGPTESVARCLRETLATAEELRGLRLQVAALGVTGVSQRLPVCMRLLVRDAVAALRPLPIRVEASDADYTVEVDRAHLFPLLVGLLEDLAAEASVDAPLRVELRGGDCVRMRVHATGLSGADTGSIAATRRFVLAAGGRMLIEPDAAVTVELPAFARGLGAGGGYGTVLIVDDDESALAMMGAVLRRAGFRVLSAEDGVAASALLRQHIHEIVAIVADAVLPGCSGVELAAEARRSVPHLPVLLVSGHSSDLLGASDFDDLPILPKPFGARVLTDRVRALLELGEAPG
ncbi:MAG: response regulator [Pseudomonadota bacterium]|nr:response regulator [Pseudomonadota bacterium]